VKVKREINLTKESKKKNRMSTTMKKIIHFKLRLNDIIEKQNSKFDKKNQE
jgi:hypothetical protein